MQFHVLRIVTPEPVTSAGALARRTIPQRIQQIESMGQLPFATGYELDGTDNQDPIIGVAVINPTWTRL